jgi:hypothetical protein
VLSIIVDLEDNLWNLKLGELSFQGYFARLRELLAIISVVAANSKRSIAISTFHNGKKKVDVPSQ